MDGPQDLGGAHGFGPILRVPDEPLFHAPWERRAFGLVLAMGATGAWNLDMSRHARERMAPAAYLSAGYYQIWLDGLIRLLVENGLATPGEISSGRAEGAGRPVPRVAIPATIPAALAGGFPTEREPRAPARFAVGERVRTKVTHKEGHTRLPRYARGRTGTVERVHGAHVFADAHAHGLGEDPQWLYTIAFAAADLWGPDGRPGDTVSLDLWEPYLEAADERR